MEAWFVYDIAVLFNEWNCGCVLIKHSTSGGNVNITSNRFNKTNISVR